MKTSLLFLCVLMLSPAISMAGVHKCTNAAGVVSYSDQPCVTKAGEKPAEVKNVHAFTAINSRDEDKKIAQACNSLLERSRSCSNDYRINSRVMEVFRVNCEVPVNREALEKEREQQQNYRNRIYKSNKDYIDEKLEKLEVRLQCQEVEPAIWKFVKDNFSAKMTAKEIQAIEHNMHEIPHSGEENSGYRRDDDRYRRRR